MLFLPFWTLFLKCALSVGSAHGYDMTFIFQSTSVNEPEGHALNWTQQDLYVTEFLSKTLANFVKFGYLIKMQTLIHFLQNVLRKVMTSGIF